MDAILELSLTYLLQNALWVNGNLKMISVYDNFLPPSVLEGVVKKVKSLDFYDDKTHPQAIREKLEKEALGEEYKMSFCGVRTESFLDVATTTDRIILKGLEKLGTSFWNRKFLYNTYAHLRLESDSTKDFIHQDKSDFAFLLYLSETNLDSGTKIFTTVNDDKDKENKFVKFVKNRFVIYDAKLPHMSWGNHGTNLSNGRLTINGFCEYV